MASPKAQKSKEKSSMSFGAYIRRYWQLYLLLLLPMLYLLIFKYIPMIYIQIAFKKYSIVQSVWKMPLAANHGFQYFIQAFADRDFRNALRNTVVLNLLDLVIGFPIPIIFAIVLNELPFQRFKKFTQTVAYMPHFLSWVIIYGLALQLFAPSTGLINVILNNMGRESVPFLNDSAHWVATYIFLGVWQSFGWNSIVYLAAIAGINRDLYEAAAVDGAGRFQRIWHITLPGIKPTIVILLISLRIAEQPGYGLGERDCHLRLQARHQGTAVLADDGGRLLPVCGRRILPARRQLAFAQARRARIVVRG